MKATETKLLEFLKKSPQFIIPIYQRTYSWTEAQCQQLWEDILRAGKQDDISAHFIGSVVYIEHGLYQVSSQPSLLVIDGQQRLTTVALLIEALARHLENLESEPLEGFSAKKLRHYYLLNPLEEGERGYKLLLTQTDKESLISLLKNKEWPENYSFRIKRNFDYFYNNIASLKGKLSSLCQGITKLLIVDVALTRGQDNPQLIFESMNSTGKALGQADLIRNYILMGLESSHQTMLYEDHWRPMEVTFGQEGYSDHFDSFMRHYLTVKTGDIPRIDDVYDAFKKYSRRPTVFEKGVNALVGDIHTFANYFCAMAFDKEKDKTLALAFKDLRELKVDVAYPFLLELYHDYTQGILSHSDFVHAIRLVESYVFRRAICGIPPNSLNKTFATFSKALKKEFYLESIKAHFLLLPSYRCFPDDEDFYLDIQARELYNFRNRSYCLRRIENFGRKERVVIDEYTIEHIMPQNPNLSPEWKKALGKDWKKHHELLLHTLGNLTLTAYNSEYSDKSFAQKRDMEGGFRSSPLQLNEGLRTLDKWNVETIIQRAQDLAEKALEIWPYPDLDPDILEKYEIQNTQSTLFTLDDYPYLAQGTITRLLFDAFRKEVFSLNSAIYEEILKNHIAFKAESNFVDVIPLKKRLRLLLTIPFHELNDPEGMARNVRNGGRWGNGDVEIILEGIDKLPYVISLVRQAFEQQMIEG